MRGFTNRERSGRTDKERQTETERQERFHQQRAKRAHRQRHLAAVAGRDPSGKVGKRDSEEQHPHRQPGMYQRLGEVDHAAHRTLDLTAVGPTGLWKSPKLVSRQVVFEGVLSVFHRHLVGPR